VTRQAGPVEAVVGENKSFFSLGSKKTDIFVA
jgi:hypothetical protein